jgi:hypothetical protein
MSFQPDPMQVLFLLNLIFKGGEAKMSDIKPNLTPVSKRKQLVENGLIEEKKIKRTILLLVTEEGWYWANDNLDAKFSQGSNASKFALMELLPKLKVFMKKNEISLFEILCNIETQESETPPENLETDNFEESIRNAYFKASGSEWNVRVRLHDLRKELQNMERSILDEQLLKMQNQEKLVLYKMDDVHNISAEDRDAAIHIGEFKRHILYLRR